MRSSSRSLTRGRSWGRTRSSSSRSRSGRRRRGSAESLQTWPSSQSRTADWTQGALRKGSPPLPNSSSIGHSAGRCPWPTSPLIPIATRPRSPMRSRGRWQRCSSAPRARSCRCYGCSTSSWRRLAVLSSSRPVLNWRPWGPRAVRPADSPGRSSPEAPARCGRVAAPAGVAQLAERQPSKLNVAGSNPVSRSTPSVPASENGRDGD